jgi:putative endonuclease
MAEHLDQGRAAEEQALEFLRRAGLRLLERNYRARGGEIDLVMQQDDTLVFVEVRYRRSQHFGSAAESVTPGKQRKLIHTAGRFLQERRVDAPCRFDVVGIHGCRQTSTIEWIKDAFRAG